MIPWNRRVPIAGDREKHLIREVFAVYASRDHLETWEVDRLIVAHAWEYIEKLSAKEIALIRREVRSGPMG